jgi:hypothetical protein
VRDDAIVKVDGGTSVLGLPYDKAAFIFRRDIKPPACLAVGRQKDLIAARRVNRTCERGVETDGAFAAL